MFHAKKPTKVGRYESYAALKYSSMALGYHQRDPVRQHLLHWESRGTWPLVLRGWALYSRVKFTNIISLSNIPATDSQSQGYARRFLLTKARWIVLEVQAVILVGLGTICERLSRKSRSNNRSLLCSAFVIERVCQSTPVRLKFPVMINPVSLLNCCKTNSESLRSEAISEPGGLYTMDTENELFHGVILYQTHSTAFKSYRREYSRSFLIRIATPPPLPSFSP